MNALVTLVSPAVDTQVSTKEIGTYSDLEVAMKAAKKACGAPRAKGESAGPKSFRFAGPNGTAYVGW